MRNAMTRKISSRLWPTLTAAVVVLGCGDSSGLPPRHRVSGTVTYKDKPLERGTISFAPADEKGRAAGGTIVDGRYSLTTQDSDDGALPGKYRVAIQAKEVGDLANVDLKIKKTREGRVTEAEKKAMAAVFPQKAAARAAVAAKSLIPARYASPETSGLTYEVKEQSNTADFPLTD
jgi:hypothetical protein